MKHKNIKDLPESILIKQDKILEHKPLGNSVENDDFFAVCSLENPGSFFKNFSSSLKEVKCSLGQIQSYFHDIESYYSKLEKDLADLNKTKALLDEEYNKMLQTSEIIGFLGLFLHDLRWFQYDKEQIIFNKEGLTQALKNFSNELTNLENRMEVCDKIIVDTMRHHNNTKSKMKLLEKTGILISDIKTILIQAKFQLNILRQSKEDMVKPEKHLIQSEFEIKKYCSELLEAHHDIIDLIGLMTSCSNFREYDIKELNHLKNREKEATNELAKEIKKIDDIVIKLEEAVKPKLPPEETWHSSPALYQ